MAVKITREVNTSSPRRAIAYRSGETIFVPIHAHGIEKKEGNEHLLCASAENPILLLDQPVCGLVPIYEGEQIVTIVVE